MSLSTQSSPNEYRTEKIYSLIGRLAARNISVTNESSNDDEDKSVSSLNTSVNGIEEIYNDDDQSVGSRNNVTYNFESNEKENENSMHHENDNSSGPLQKRPRNSSTSNSNSNSIANSPPPVHPNRVTPSVSSPAKTPPVTTASTKTETEAKTKIKIIPRTPLANISKTDLANKYKALVTERGKLVQDLESTYVQLEEVSRPRHNYFFQKHNAHFLPHPLTPASHGQIQTKSQVVKIHRLPAKPNHKLEKCQN